MRWMAVASLIFGVVFAMFEQHRPMFVVAVVVNSLAAFGVLFLVFWVPAWRRHRI